MKALVYTAIKTVEMKDYVDPQPGRDDVLVRVRATGICGSDLHGFLGHQKRRQPGLVLGHETVGVVEQGPDDLVGKRVSVNPLISCGICPACRGGRQNCCRYWRLLGLDTTQGGFAEKVAIPLRNVYLLPDHVSDAAAVMVEPLANAVHILSMIPPSAGLMPTTVIVGAGTLGASILSVALSRGLNVLFVTETNPRRMEVARQLGAPNVVNPLEQDWIAEVMRLTDGYGVEVVVDAVGLAKTRSDGASAVAKGGTVLLLGMDEGPTSFDFQDLVRREVRLQCSFAYSERDFAEALNLVVSGKVNFEKWTDVMPIDQGQAAFDRLVSDPGDRLKIALVP